MSIFEPNLEVFGLPVLPLSPDDQTNARLSAILNEASHAFDWHAEGVWQSEHKDGFARLLIPMLMQHPKLIRNILKLNNRVFSMVAYRAVELIKNHENH